MLLTFGDPRWNDDMLFDDRPSITYYLRLPTTFCCEKTRIYWKVYLRINIVRLGTRG